MATSTILDMVGTLNGLAKTSNLGGLAAANAWAGTTNMGLIAALNIKAGNGTNPRNWLGLNGVCNQLAGTTGLEALQALQLLLAAGGGGGGTDVLASHTYAPSVQNTLNLPATMTLLDTTNAALTFTMPASGKAIVDVSVTIDTVNPSSAQRCVFGLYNSAGTTQYGNTAIVQDFSANETVKPVLLRFEVAAAANSSVTVCLAGGSTSAIANLNIKGTTEAIGGGLVVTGAPLIITAWSE